MLEDSFDDKSLSIEHGASLRLIAPEHYGYKNLKHLMRKEFYSTMPVVIHGISAFLDHPRAYKKNEERGRWVPDWILRYVHWQLIPGTVKEIRKAMVKHERIT